MPGTTDITLNWVETLEDANAFMRWLGGRRPWLAVDTETGGFDWWRMPLRTVQFGDRHTGWCIEWDRWRGLICEALARYEGPIAMHNSKFDTHFLEVNGAPVKRWLVHDTRAMAHILNPAVLSGLKPRAARELGPWAWHGEKELKLAMTKGNWGWGDLPVELLWRYAAFDTCLTAQLAEELWPRVDANPGYRNVYGLELASTQALTDMERRGILTDGRYLSWAQEEWGRTLQGLKHVIRAKFLVGNPNSDREVVAHLKSRGWEPVLFTEKGGVKLDSDVLKGLVDNGNYEIAEYVLAYREYHKLLGTYVDNIVDLADAGGRLHASINPLGARTGRMSVGRPSLQNLPAKDGRIRDAFVAASGNVLIAADYDQVEMRIFAHYSGSRSMIDAVRYGDAMQAQGRKGFDFHSMSARMVFGLAMDADMDPDAKPFKPFRKKVKTVGFGKVYGAGPEQLAAIMGSSVEEARHVIALYEQTFPETAKHGFPARVAEALVMRDRADGDPYVTTAYGRKEPCWPSEAYKAVNYLIQGTAADVLKAKIVALSRTWLGAHMLLPIHDEIIFEVPEGAEHEALATIRATMPETEAFAVPLTVDATVVRRWGDKYDRENAEHAASVAGLLAAA